MNKAICRKKKRMVKLTDYCSKYKGSGLRADCSQCVHSIYVYKTGDGRRHLEGA